MKIISKDLEIDLFTVWMNRQDKREKILKKLQIFGSVEINF